MEQHPVPRNISSFEFHLIGDMTLSQFFYLAGAAGAGFIIYKAAPFPDLIKYLMIGVTGFIGFSFAFLPIQERPLDKWIVAFIRSIFSPTQFIWQKDGSAPDILVRPATINTHAMPQTHIDAHKEANDKLRAYLSTLPKSSHEMLNVAEQNYINKTLSLFGPATVTVSVPQNHQRSSVSINISTVSNVKSTPGVINITAAQSNQQPKVIVSTTAHSPVPQLQTFIPVPPPDEEKPESETFSTIPPVNQPGINPVPSSPPVPLPNTEYDNLQKQLKSLMAEKDLLAKQLEQLKTDAGTMKSPAKVVIPTPVEADKADPTIKYISAKAAVDKLGMPNLPEAPNIVIGVIKDPQRKILPNIIITIKDKTGMPLRALKTNKLGQFATATPLPNGTYLLEVDDPLKRYVFDTAEIVLNGKVFLPIEIVTKGEKELMREKLNKELFGNTSSI